jgi:hypothetical protein
MLCILQNTIPQGEWVVKAVATDARGYCLD